MNIQRSSFAIKQFLALTVFLTLSACSSQNPDAPVILNGQHATDWVYKHGAAFLADDQSCRECHGSDLGGGIVAPAAAAGAPVMKAISRVAAPASSGVTCFSADFNNITCHGDNGPFAHSPEFTHSHGMRALQNPQMTVEGPAGFDECVGCHGAGFEGRPFPQPDGSFQDSANCLTQCHSSEFTYIGADPAPHSAAGVWDEVHSSTDPANAASCAECHANRGDFRMEIWGELPFQFDAAAKPGCFNNTLCHADMANPHAEITNWTTPAVHGVRAKTSPEKGLLFGFVNCSVCHKGDFSNNCANTCHIPPHAENWAGTGTYTHTTTSVDNVAACTECHRNDNGLNVLGTPGCFNNTLCHDTKNPHAASWDVPANHGTSAKLPVPPLGVNELASFVSCQACHGNDFTNSCLGCHTGATDRPHPASWDGTGTYTHISTDPSNVIVCTVCHRNDNGQNVVGDPGCFNNTLCHGVQGSPHVDPWTPAANHGVSAKAAPDGANSVQSFVRCSICHSAGTTPAIIWASCGVSLCHSSPSSSRPHPLDWQGTGIYTHQTTNGANAAVCAGCHSDGGNSPLNPPIPPPAGTAAGCFNSTLCHGQAVSPHDPNWSGPANHGTSAKDVDGYSSCTSCHTASFDYNCTNQCHTPPHPGAWDVKAVYTHQSTDQSNAGECSKCHRTSGTGSAGVFMASGWPLSTPLAGAGCFANNLCHGEVGGTGPAHPVHMALPTPANTCTTCHKVTPGVLNFNTQYNAKSGAATFNGTAKTCANISCHGGQTTPIWASGAIAVPGNGNSDCKICHINSTTQYNGYVSGEHNKHVVDKRKACTACHDTTRLASTHFTTLNTPALNNPAATIKSSLQYSGGTCASPGCHGSERW